MKVEYGSLICCNLCGCDVALLLQWKDYHYYYYYYYCYSDMIIAYCSNHYYIWKGRVGYLVIIYMSFMLSNNRNYSYKMCGVASSMVVFRITMIMLYFALIEENNAHLRALDNNSYDVLLASRWCFYLLIRVDFYLFIYLKITN